MSSVRQVLVGLPNPYLDRHGSSARRSVASVPATFYSAARPFEEAGVPPPAWGSPNNLHPFPLAVVRHMLADLKVLAKTHEVIVWQHLWHCFPEVAERLPDLFPALRVAETGDDCPEASPRVSLPVAKHFNAAVHYLHVYDPSTGALVRDVVYGGADARFAALGPSAWTEEAAIDVEAKARVIESGTLPMCVVHVGAVLPRRKEIIDAASPILARSGVRCRWHGRGTKSGWLDPKDCAGAYSGATFGFNAALSSLYNVRFYDLMRLGVVQIAHDPWRELPAFGFVPGETHLEFDGTGDGLARTVLEWMNRRADLARIVRTAHSRILAFVSERSRTAAIESLHWDHAEAIEAERGRKT